MFQAPGRDDGRIPTPEAASSWAGWERWPSGPGLRDFSRSPSGPPSPSPSQDPVYDQTGAQADFYRIVMGQYRQSFHPDLPAAKRGVTRTPRASSRSGAIWAPRSSPPRGRRSAINFTNLLPNVHPLPVDNTLPGAEAGQNVNRAVAHLHGGFVHWPSDGGPFHWSTPLGQHGPSWVSWLPNRLGIKTDDAYWSNQQTARFMWYHDHAMGITRLNAYAGSRRGLLPDRRRRDPHVRLRRSRSLPDQIPGIPLVIQDKSFKNAADRWGRVGDLYYPSVYGPAEPEAPTPVAAHASRLVRAGVLRGHRSDQRHGLPAAHAARGRPPLPAPERHPVARLEPPVVQGKRRRPGRREHAPRRGPTSSRSAPRGASCRRRRSCRPATRSTSTTVPRLTTRPATAWCWRGRSAPTC